MDIHKAVFETKEDERVKNFLLNKNKEIKTTRLSLTN